MMNRLLLVGSAGLLMGCGVVGAPVPPEFVGVAPTIEKQKQQQARENAEREKSESAEPDSTHDAHDMGLPPSRPVGTR
jgi:hypothetical protein